MAKSSTDSKSVRSSRRRGGDDPASQLKGRRFGRVLTKLGKITRDQVHEALRVQRARRDKGERELVGKVLVELGLIDEFDVLEALAGQAGMRFLRLEADDIDPDLTEKLPAESANTYQIVPVAYDESSKVLTIALKSPDNFRAVDDLRLLMGFNVEAVVAPESDIDAILNSLYGKAGTSMVDVMSSLGESDALAALQGRGDSVDLEELVFGDRRQQSRPFAQSRIAAGHQGQGE